MADKLDEIRAGLNGNVFGLPDSQSARAIAWLVGEVEKARAYIGRHAQCPCCTETAKCHPECTLREECPNEYSEMMRARRALLMH